MSGMKIGELASRAGVTAKTVRYYEEIGVLPEPERAPNGYRDYQPDAVDRLQFVRDARDTGLTLTEIASILDLRSKGEGTCQHVIDLLERHLEDLDLHIETLLKTRDQLVALTERGKRLDPTRCTDPNRCQTIVVGTDMGGRSRVRTDHDHSTPHRHSHR